MRIGHGKEAHQQAAERVPDQHVRAGHVGTGHQEVQLVDHVQRGARRRANIAGALPRTVVDAHARLQGNGRCDAGPGVAAGRPPRLKHDRWAAVARADQVQAVAADVHAAILKRGMVGRRRARLRHERPIAVHAAEVIDGQRHVALRAGW
jgi:hypothetical protein